MVAFWLGHKLASRERIARIPGQAVADCFVIGCVAFRVRATYPSDETRILAETVDASFVERTLTMTSAARNTTRGMTDLTKATFLITTAESVRNLFARNLRVASVARVTSAKFPMLYGVANSVASANSRTQTRILTLTIEALIVNGTVDIRTTPDDAFVQLTNASIMAFGVVNTLGWRGQNFDAVLFWITGMVWQTAANTVVVPGSAYGIETTGSVLFARVLARLTNTGLKEPAVMVGAAAWHTDSSFTDETDSAVTVVDAVSGFPQLFAFCASIALESWRA